MKIAVTADWHLNNFQEFSKPILTEWDEELYRYVESNQGNTMNSRLFNQLNTICDMRDYCEINGINQLLIAGDIFHKRGTIDVSVYNAGYKVLSSFKEFGVWVTAIAGNHDDIDNSQVPITSLHPLQEIIHIIEKPEDLELFDQSTNESVYILALPYSKDKKHILGYIDGYMKTHNSKESILLCHLGITGGVVGSGQYSMKDEYSLGELRYNKWKYLVAGHYHQPQILEYNSIYTGSPTQNNFGDERDGNNGFFVIDTNKRWDMRFIPLNAPRFITVTKDLLEDYTAEQLKGNYIRAIATGDTEQQLHKALEEKVDDFSYIRVEIEKGYEESQRSEINIASTFEEAVQLYAKEHYKGDNLAQIQDLGLEILKESM